MLIGKLRGSFVGEAGVTVTAVREWNKDGHEVGVYRLDKVPDEGGEAALWETMLCCDCDFLKEGEERIIGGENDNDPYKCVVRLAVQAEIISETRAMLAPVLASDGLKAAILEIHRRIEAHEYLGQVQATIIYVQEAAEILGAPVEAVWKACDELYAEEKLELSGAIFCPFEPHFRLPKLMAAIMAYVIEEPLGWPNGDAGGMRVGEFEAKVQDETGFASGRQAFGKSWPHIDKLILADFALDWLSAALDVAASGPEGMAEVRAITVDMLAKPGSLLETTHPEISVKVFAMFLFEMVQVAFERAETVAEMTGGSVTFEEELGNIAKYFGDLAAQFRK